MHAGQRGFLAAVLAGGGTKGAADLADQRAGEPQAAGLIEEVAHLRRHVAETRRRADDDRVIIGEFARRGNRCGLVGLQARGGGDIIGDEFGYPLDGDAGAGNLGRAGGDGVGERLHMAIARVIEDEYLGHGGFL